MNTRRWYFDTGVFVTPILKNRPQAVVDACLAWQRRAHDGEVEAVTSHLTWDEVAHVAGRVPKPFDRARAAEAGRLLRACQWLRFVAIDEMVIARAQALLARAGNGPRDCVHAASALLHAGGNLVTLDSGFTSGGGLTVSIISLS